MATTITKTKTRVKKKNETVKVDAGALLADEFGNAKHAEENTAKPIIERLKEVKERLLAFITAHHQPSDGGITLKGSEFKLEIGACALQAACVKDGGYQRVREMVGDEVFFKLVKITLEDLRAYLTPEQLSEILSEQTEYNLNKRNITVTKVEADV